MESFLGFANFYKCFIKNFSYIVKPLNKLKREKRLEMGRRILKNIQKVKGKDHKLTITCFIQNKRKIQSRDSIIFQTLKHVWDMSDFNITSNLHSYLALFVFKTLLVVWYFIIDLILLNLYGYLALF